MVFKKLKAKSLKLSFGIRSYLRNRISKPNRDAIFIFGLQKSGTSAIARLLAEKTGKSVTIDTKYLWQPHYARLISGKIKIKNHVNKYSYPFSKEIIKEPNSTFLIHQIKDFFYLNRYVFIVRNPLDNIRSILNRLNIPGDLENIDLERVNDNWKHLFLSSNGKDYINVLANLWVKANGQTEIINSKNCILVRYEDFIKDKENFIEKLVFKVGLESVNNISEFVDLQYQPKGNSNVNLKTFYGNKNYNKIIQKCSPIMRLFNYS